MHDRGGCSDVRGFFMNNVPWIGTSDHGMKDTEVVMLDAGKQSKTGSGIAGTSSLFGLHGRALRNQNIAIGASVCCPQFCAGIVLQIELAYCARDPRDEGVFLILNEDRNFKN
jgi:hypothetical protein